MSIEVLVPNLPESVADATLVGWHKKPGDSIRRDENLVDLETDKVVLEVPAPADGVLAEILKSDGDVVTQGQTLAVIESAAVDSSSAAPTAPDTAVEETASPSGPSARRALAENELTAAQVQGTGKGGRVTRLDVERHVSEHKETVDQAVSESAATTLPSAAPSVPGAAPTDGARPEQRVPMTRLRARVAERLVQAQHTAAILTTFNEVDLTAVMEIRNRYKKRFEEEHRIRLGFMSFFVKAAVDALKRFPVVNASVDGQDIVYHGYFDIGIAVGSPRGLVVPILRDADQLGFGEIENKIADFGNKAQAGNLSYEDLTGGTFTISNGGIFGSMLSTPILNPPQSAILGMHAIQQRAMVVEGEIVARPMMYLALSYDHRIIDGREAVQFLLNIKQRLEDPTQLLLEI